MAVDGSSGKILWSVASQEDQEDAIVVKRSNFYTPLLIPGDQDSDGLVDVIIMHGGDPFRAPGQKAIIPAKLLLVSSRTGLTDLIYSLLFFLTSSIEESSLNFSCMQHKI